LQTALNQLDGCGRHIASLLAQVLDGKDHGKYTRRGVEQFSAVLVGKGKEVKEQKGLKKNTGACKKVSTMVSFRSLLLPFRSNQGGAASGPPSDGEIEAQHDADGDAADGPHLDAGGHDTMYEKAGCGSSS